ncbi:MAG: hypothetical protein V2I35_06905 [Desulfocapsaceae bacterium]|nr:hypothetical protein [Desulfocapsaceae bacterium]
MKRLPLHSAFSIPWSWLLLVCFIFSAGCAAKPYGPSIEGDDYSRLEQQYRSYLEDLEFCAGAFDGETVVSWKHALDHISFSGYFKTLLPASVQFTALTPLKQPLFALSSNGEWFQSVDISKKLFRKGSLRSFAIRHEIPLAFLSGEWGAWLAGRPSTGATTITSIAQDTDNRGVWFSVTPDSGAGQPQERTLVDLVEQKMIERAVLDKQGKTAALIRYRDWQIIGRCPQPMEIQMSGLSFGAEATLRFSDVQETPLSKNGFNLPIPPGFKRQFLP